MDEPAPDGELESGLTIPMDEDFDGNGGGDLALYPDALWERELFPLDELPPLAFDCHTNIVNMYRKILTTI